MVRTSIFVCDALDGLRDIDDESVQTIVTSPPYYGLRDYCVDGQIGLEPTPSEYITNLVAVFREARRALRDDGTLWLNIGDSYQHAKRPAILKQARNTGAFHQDLLKPKDLLGMPWAVAFALRDDGWYLRSDIIWHKPNVLPESVHDRPTNAYEHIFLFAKSDRYFYDAEAVKEQAVCMRTRGRALHPDLISTNGNGGLSRRKPTGFRNRRNVWSVDEDEYEQFLRWKSENDGLDDIWPVMTKPFKGAHFATFPPELIEPCIKAGSSEGQTVLDPFSGSGTTALVANRFGRDAILIEISQDYAEMSYHRLRDEGVEEVNITGLQTVRSTVQASV